MIKFFGRSPSSFLLLSFTFPAHSLHSLLFPTWASPNSASLSSLT